MSDAEFFLEVVQVQVSPVRGFVNMSWKSSLPPDLVLKPMIESTTKEVHKMLEAFKRREPCKLYFNRPVSATAGADFMRGYLTVIKQPMDLGTVTRKLEEDRRARAPACALSRACA